MMTVRLFLFSAAVGISGISFAIAAKPPLLQSQVKGLLVVRLPDGTFVGAASQMNATVIPAEDKSAFAVRFNQNVGEMMTAATAEVEKLMRVRHPDTLPTGHVIEFGFADKHSPKDGPSAAVACALMAESIIVGTKLDPAFAVTGDLTATGEVRPIGGVGAKVRGASRKESRIFAVPKANRSSIEDLYVTNGVAAVADVQIILVENFDQALILAKAEKDPETQAAIDEFGLVQKAIARNPGNASHPQVVEKLKKVIKTIPNHESARLIALHGSNRGPRKLSLVGSLDAIQTGASQLSETLKDGSWTDQGMDDPLWDNVSRLTSLREAVDIRTQDYLNAFLSTATFFKTNRDRKYMTPNLKRDLMSSLEKIKIEEKKLLNSREIQEAMINQ